MTEAATEAEWTRWGSKLLDGLTEVPRSTRSECSDDLRDSEPPNETSEAECRTGCVTVAQDTRSERSGQGAALKPLKLIFEEDDEIGHAVASEMLKRKDEREVIIEMKKPSTYWRPCSGCGAVTHFVCAKLCDAATYMPKDSWFTHQATPLCARCSRLHGRCHYCRGVSWASPPRGAQDPEASGDPEASPSYSGRTFFPRFET